MIAAADLKELLCRSAIATDLEDGVRVSTHVLYPSNSAISVMIRGGQNEFVVSDEGGATQEIYSAGVRTTIPDRIIRGQVRNHGLLVQDGVIYSPKLPVDGIYAGILLVANGSRSAADWALDHLKFQAPRNFRADLAELLGKYFHDNMKQDSPVVGASNKPHKFNYVIYLSGERRLLIDPVVNDASSINSRVVANLDVRNAEDPLIDQLIIYDDRLRWNASDLKLLEIGAKTLAFSQAEPEIKRRVA